MEIWVWVAGGVMAAVIFALLIKIYLLRKSAGEIADAFADRLITETNTLIDISSGDRAMRKLADTVNRQLRKLRMQRHCYLQGDRELKNAVTNIAHDLRTPLTAICGYLDLLDREEKTETVEQYLSVIRNRAEFMAQLTEELFEYSVILAGERKADREAVVINAVLEESIAAFYTVLKEKNIRPDIRMPETKVIRTIDRSDLTRVFANLLQNAVAYSDGDLEVTLSGAGEIVFRNAAAGLNGIQAGRLFDRFYTVKAARKSTGLGLSIARTLVERMGGTISAEYENGRLCIRILLPEGTI